MGRWPRGSGHPAQAAPSAARSDATRSPIIVPCHRVIAQGGGLGGFTGGLPTKRILLGLEGYRLPTLSVRLF